MRSMHRSEPNRLNLARLLEAGRRRSVSHQMPIVGGFNGFLAGGEGVCACTGRIKRFHFKACGRNEGVGG